LASRNSHGSRFTATISPYDSQSFVTDHQQTWPTRLQQPRLPTPSTSLFGPDPETDFVLFPTTTTSTTTVRRQTTPAPATSRTAPSYRLGSAYNGHQHSQVNNSTRQNTSSVSPIQNPRVSNIIQGNGSGTLSTSSQQFSPTGQQQQNFYASSAPSSSAALEQQSPRTRPPVPLFSSRSTGDMSRRTSHVEGSLSHRPSLTLSTMLTGSSSGMVAEDQAFNELFNSRDREVRLSDNSFNQMEFSLPNFEGFTQPMPTLINENASPCVSLQDVQYNSEPASTTFTNLTTPGSDPFDSPFAHSTDTSPIFAADHNLPAESDKWDPLFPADEFVGGIPAEHSFDEYFPDLPVAPQMSRNTSSPGQSSTRSSNQGRHSKTSGVSSRRRDKPLPAIIIDDPTDSVKVKRARNTLAARKSRQKRVQVHDELQAEVEDMKSQRDYWKLRAIELGHQE